ncbi:plasmid replication protein RepB, partial [Pseudomonas sp. P5_152]|uniref:plasmid replication protein RepB n=1 Tax=Pseudomonas sp. P5_152 TaxID=3043442 RepID=UPI002A366298
VAPAPMQSGWELIVVRTDGTLDYMTVARSDRRKVYKSLEAITLDAKRVGFDEVTTQLGALHVA